jgi:hypothetical protein
MVGVGDKETDMPKKTTKPIVRHEYAAMEILAHVNIEPELYLKFGQPLTTGVLGTPNPKLDYPKWQCEGDCIHGLREEDDHGHPVADLYEDEEEARSTASLGLALCKKCIELYTDYRFKEPK